MEVVVENRSNPNETKKFSDVERIESSSVHYIDGWAKAFTVYYFNEEEQIEGCETFVEGEWKFQLV